MAKEVRYDIYCKYCEHFIKSPSDDPCNGCLGKPDNEGSHVPVYFKKIKPLINYLNVDPNVVGYTRDPDKSKNWSSAAIPSEADLKAKFKINEKDGDWYEKEDN